MSSEMLHAALEYSKKGLSIIPCGKDKKPLISWLPYQHEQATEEEINAWWGKWPDANPAIVTGAISGIVVVDIDDMPDGILNLAKYIPQDIETPTAETPRGGLHLYFKHPGGVLNNNAGKIHGCDFRGDGGYVLAPPGTNGTGKGYRWLKSIFEVPLAPLPSSYISLAFSLYRDVTHEGGDSVTRRYEALQDVTISLNEGGRDNSLFHIANSLVKGGMAEANTSYVLNIIANNCNPPFPEKEISAKIQSAIQRAKRRERNFQNEVEEWVSVTSGYWSVTECNQALQSVTKEEKTAVRVAVHRLHKAGKIERHGNKDGCYRRVETDVEPVNFLTASTDEFPITWPLGIHDLCKIYPGNIIVVAGSKGAGKTSFLLNTVRLNMQKHEIIYLNSEMGDTEFQGRLLMFKDLRLNDWNVKAFHRASNFSDLITPERKIFIVDYLEITTDFWKVSQYIQEIHKKLKNGICIIALQKIEGKDTGRGGDFSKEKSRLYLSLDYIADQKQNRVKIIDAKNWRANRNPRGLYRTYKLIGGSRYVGESEWKD